jgi:hypothetical protein
MAKTKVTIYPVDNGDTTLLSLSDGLQLLIDCKIRISAEDPDDDAQYDVKKNLVDRIKRKGKMYYVDLFVNSHPDKDHCHGFGKHFYSGDPADYGSPNADNEEIVIGELWVTPMLFTTDQAPDANALRNEANRRIRLWQAGDADRNKFGNRIVIIGYDEDDKFEKVPTYVPGTMVNSFNGLSSKCFELFIHAPFKNHLVEGRSEKDRNFTSIVFQARFITNPNSHEPTCFAIFGGDADHYVFEKIVELSKKHSNDDKLWYDILLSTHHCSWTFFNDTPLTDDTREPKSNSLAFLKYGRPGAYIIASSRLIEVKEPNPPHYAASAEYLKVLSDKNRFLNTAAYPTKDAPEPIEFIIDDDGKVILEKAGEEKKRVINAAVAIAAQAIIKKPYGGKSDI